MAHKNMNPQWKSRWVTALESGKYKQTRNFLKRTKNKKNSFCCLGVLCQIDPKIKSKKIPHSFGFRWLFDEEPGVLSPLLKEKYGISERAEEKLIKMNDIDGKDFKEIANWIRKNL